MNLSILKLIKILQLMIYRNNQKII